MTSRRIYSMAMWLRLVFAGLVFTVAYFTVLQMNLPSCIDDLPTSLPIQAKPIKPVVKIYNTTPPGNYLNIVLDVFRKQGYVVDTEGSVPWDVLWSHPYPFNSLAFEMNILKSHQKVNHFPGSGVITVKSKLVKLSISAIPKAFLIPEQKDLFLTYCKKHPEKLWMQKSNMHRGIKVHNVSELDFNSRNTFVQEYVDNPLLISGRKFDIGVYVVLTSVNPLRVYMFSSDILLRFCSKDYYPFNSSLVDSYVVGDDYVPLWEIPALQKYFVDLNYTAKDSLNAYLLHEKKSPEKLWSQIMKTIQDVFIKTEDDIISASLKLGNLRNFFELMRFDFVVDVNMNVYLLEANMSPNLSAEHFPPNRLLYEQVLFSTLSIVGLTRRYPDSFLNRNELDVSEKDIQVFPEECSSQTCDGSCKIQKCKVCNPCMSKELKDVAKTSYLEHVNHNKFRRVIPNPIDFRNTGKLRSTRAAQPTDMNVFMDRWFKGKCLQDLSFCQ